MRRQDWHESPLDYVLDCVNQSWRLIAGARPMAIRQQDVAFAEDVALLQEASNRAAKASRAQLDAMAGAEARTVCGVSGESMHVAVMTLAASLLVTIESERIFAGLGRALDDQPALDEPGLWDAIAPRIHRLFGEFTEADLARVRADLLREQALARRQQPAAAEVPACTPPGPADRRQQAEFIRNARRTPHQWPEVYRLFNAEFGTTYEYAENGSLQKLERQNRRDRP